MRKTFRLLDLPVAALILLLFFRLPAEGKIGGNPALAVTAGGKTTVEPLGPDRALTIEGALGPTRIEVLGGRARITESPCAGKECIRTGWVGGGYGAAICAPNRVAVRITGANGGVDAVAR